MNTLIFWLYIASIADNVKDAFGGIAVSIALVFLLIGAVYTASQFDDIVKKRSFYIYEDNNHTIYSMFIIKYLLPIIKVFIYGYRTKNSRN